MRRRIQQQTASVGLPMVGVISHYLMHSEKVTAGFGERRCDSIPADLVKGLWLVNQRKKRSTIRELKDD